MQKSKQNLKKEQIKFLTEALKTKLSKNEYIRIQAVLLRKRGYSHEQITDITGKSEDALKKWIANFNKKGLLGLKDQPVTKPRNYKLTREQKEQIKAILHSKKPQDLGFQGEFWSPQSLKQLIQQKFKIIYKSAETYRKLFKFCGFSYQKVKYQDSRKDEQRTAHEKLRLTKKLKKGVLKMYW